MQHVHNAKSFGRRHFLQIGAASPLGLSLASALALETHAAPAISPTKAKNVIFIWLAGGPSTIDMWDMKPHAPERTRGEFKPIPTRAADIQVCEYLPKLATVMDRCTLIRSVTHTLAEHGIGTEYMTTGHPPNPALKYPAVGALASRLLPQPAGVPSYLTLGSQANSGAGFLGAAYNPLEVTTFPFGLPPTASNGIRETPKSTSVASLPNGFSAGDLRRRESLLKKLDEQFRRLDESTTLADINYFQHRAADILRSGKTKRALDLSDEDGQTVQAYGVGLLGYSALAARRLIEAGVRFVTIGLGGWDTHSEVFPKLRYHLLPQLDRALARLISDLNERGLLDSTIVYCAGEFGRTPNVNDSGGRDHWPRATSLLLAGGGFKRGYVDGATDEHGREPIRDARSPGDICATLFHQLGFPPDHRVPTSTPGRHEPIFQDGQVIREILD